MECAGGIGLLIFLVILIVVVAIPIASITIRTVRQSTVGIVETLGRFDGERQAGFNFIWPFFQKLYIVDLKEQVFALKPQPVITHDNVTMNIDAVIYFQVTNAYKATYEIKNLVQAVEQLALTSLRNVIGEMTLDETLASRDKVNDHLQQILDEATTKWGLKVNRVELKDINPPKDIEEAMQKQMRAERTKRAAILTAEGEKAAAITIAEGQRQAAILEAEGKKQSAILNAEGEKQSIVLKAEAEAEKIRFIKGAEAQMIERVFQAIHNGRPTPELIHLKYLEALQKVADGQGNTLMLPYEASAFMGSVVSAAQGFRIPQYRPATMPRPGVNPSINPES